MAVGQIPRHVRAFNKMLADKIISTYPELSKSELFRVLYELLVHRWLSVPFLVPEFYGILPKTMSFSDKYKSIFFATAKKVSLFVDPIRYCAKRSKCKCWTTCPNTRNTSI